MVAPEKAEFGNTNIPGFALVPSGSVPDSHGDPAQCYQMFKLNCLPSETLIGIKGLPEEVREYLRLVDSGVINFSLSKLATAAYARCIVLPRNLPTIEAVIPPNQSWSTRQPPRQLDLGLQY